MANTYMILLFSVVTCFSNTYAAAAATPPPVFIFGDSSADVGTNTHIPECLVRADFPHNGIDFANSKATGRYSNGFVTTDYICKSMGYKKSPAPYLSYKDKSSFPIEMFDGVNFASAGSGLLDTTGEDAFIVPVTEQINQFRTVRNNVRKLLGEYVDEFFARSIFVISVGTNDMEYSFLRGLIAPDPSIFSNAIILAYRNAIDVLYGLGARNFGFISALPVGCTPMMRVQNSTGGCLYSLNQLALDFYANLNALAKEISLDRKDFKYSLGNTYAMMMNVIENSPRSQGFIVNSACCGSGRFNAEVFCGPTTDLCQSRDKYAFWDTIHPTDAASKSVATALFDGGSNYVSPITFRQLVAGTSRAQSSIYVDSNASLI